MKQGIVGHEQRGIALVHESGKGRVDLGLDAGIDHPKLLPDGESCGLQVPQLRLGFRATRIHENGDRSD